jgi:putative effector of murein hydrolase
MTADSGMVWLLFLTLGAYVIGCWVNQKFGRVWSSPILISPLLIIAVLSATHTDYATYQTSTQLITFLLGPAQMAMVIPLYKHADVFLRHLRPILTGVSVGSCSGVASVIGIAYLFQLSHPTIVSLAPKSITTPMAVSVSHLLGGLPELTALFVTMTGLSGILIGPVILRWAGITNNLVKGLAMGTAASMVGAARAAQWGEPEGAMGILGMTLSAVFMAVLAPELLWVLI